MYASLLVTHRKASKRRFAMRKALCKKIVEGLVPPELKGEADKIFRQIERIDSARFDIPEIINICLFLPSLVISMWLVFLAITLLGFSDFSGNIATKLQLLAIVAPFAFAVAALHLNLLPNLLNRALKPVVEKRKKELLELINSDRRTNQVFRKIFSVAEGESIHEKTENIGKYLN